MANNDYIPSNEVDLLTWLTSFVSNAATVAVDLSLPTGALDEVTAARTAFVAAHSANLNLQNSARAARQTKDNAKVTVLSSVRSLVKQLQANPNLTDSQRASMQITIPDKVPTLIAAPTSIPVLSVDFSQRGVHTISARDSTTPFSKAKPKGAVGFDLWQKVGSVQPADNTNMEYLGRITAQAYDTVFEESQYGQQAYYVACWVTQKGIRGNTGDFTNATISK